MKQKLISIKKYLKIVVFAAFLAGVPIISAGQNISNPHPIVVQAKATFGQKNALKQAKRYLNTMAFSKKGLIKQLKYEGYTTKEANYAVKHCNANWKKQAVKKAKQYLFTMSFSKKRLISQLKYEGFTKKQAEYGAKKAYK